MGAGHDLCQNWERGPDRGQPSTCSVPEAWALLWSMSFVQGSFEPREKVKAVERILMGIWQAERGTLRGGQLWVLSHFLKEKTGDLALSIRFCKPRNTFPANKQTPYYSETIPSLGVFPASETGPELSLRSNSNPRLAADGRAGPGPRRASRVPRGLSCSLGPADCLFAEPAGTLHISLCLLAKYTRRERSSRSRC